MNTYKYVGVIAEIKDVEQVTEKFKKRLLIFEDGTTEFPEILSFEFTQANCDKLDAFKKGDNVELMFSLKGRSWQKDKKSPLRYFTSFAAFNIKAYDGEVAMSAGLNDGDESSDLPF